MTLSQIYNLDSGFDAREKINTSFETIDILWSLTASGSSGNGSTSSVYSVNGMTGSIVLKTDDISEGSNLYFTESRVRATTLDGFLSSSGTISSMDTILEAIQKLDGNIPNINITSNTIPKGNGTSIVDGSWQFTSNDIIPITTGSNIGNSSSRIGTIFISNNTPNIDYYGDLTFHNGTSTKMTLNGNGDLGLGLNAFPYRFAAISNDNADFSAVKLLSANQAQFLELGWAGLNSTYYLKLTSGSSQDIILTPSRTTLLKGIDTTSSNYALKVQSSVADMATFRNDGYVNIALGNITFGVHTAAPTVSAIFMGATPSASNYSLAYNGGNVYINGDTVNYSVAGSVKGTTNATYTQFVHPFSVGSIVPSGANAFVVSGESYLQGSGATSNAYTLKVDNSASSVIAHFRNDQFIGFGTTTEVIGASGHKFEQNGVFNGALGGDYKFSAAFSTSDSFGIDIGAGIALGGKYNTAGLINPFAGISGVKLNATDGNFEGRLNLWIRGGIGGAATSFTSIPYGSKVRNGMGIKNPLALLHLNGDNADVFISESGCINTTGYAGKFYANVANSSDNIGIYSEVANGANNYAAILMGGNVGIGTSSPLSTLHSEYNINDTVAVIRASNTNTGVSAGVSFNAYNGTNAVEFGILSTTHTTFSASYGTANDVYLRSSSGAGRINIINAAGNPILFGSSVSVPAAMISPASGNFAIGTSTPTTSTRLHVYRAVNDFLYELKVENPTNGVSAASSILIQSDSGKLEFGQLSTLFTTYTGYGQTGDTFIRSGVGSRNMNFLTDASNVGKMLFFSRLNPTTSASTPSFAIDGSRSAFNTLPISSSVVYIKGEDSTSSNYALKVDNSASSPLLYVRNDGMFGSSSTFSGYNTYATFANLYLEGTTRGGVVINNNSASSYTGEKIGFEVGGGTWNYGFNASLNAMTVVTTGSSSGNWLFGYGTSASPTAKMYYSSSFGGFGINVGTSVSAVGHFKMANAGNPTDAIMLAETSGGVANFKIQNDGYVIQKANNSAIADGSLSNSELSFYINEAGNTLVVKVKYAGGTVKTGTVALV